MSVIPKSVRVLILLGLVAAQFGAAPARNAPVISDGQWQGVLFAVGTGNAEGNSWVALWEGGLEFVSAGGALDGDFTISGNLSVETSGGSGQAGYIGDGLIFGRSSAPLMDLEHISVNGTLTVAGFTVPISQTHGPDELKGTVPVTLITATCSTVTGDWTGPIMVALGGQVNGFWVANRVAELPGQDSDAYMREVARLLQDMLEWQAITYGAGFNFTPLLYQALDRAEDLNRRLDRLGDCSSVDRDAFATVISGVVATMIQFALDHPEGLNTNDLLRLASIGIRMGILGEGSGNPDLAADLESGLLALAGQRLEEIEDNPDCGLVSANASLALAIGVLFGDEGLSEAATGVLIGGLTCSG